MLKPHPPARPRLRWAALATATLAGPLTLALAVPAGAVAAGTSSDFDGDGRAETVAGIPQAADNTITGAGAISILPGSATGATTTGALTLTQDSPGVPGASETDDAFGATTVHADLTGDGRDDLVVAAPGEDDTTGHTDAGGLVLFEASADGSLEPDPSMRLAPAAQRVTGDRCGEALAAGDFNDDGHDDILTFCPGSTQLWWLDGASRTIRSTAPTTQLLPTRDATTAPRSMTSVARAHAAAGDIDGDGYDDALVTFTQSDGSTPLFVLYGSATGPSTGDMDVLPDAGGAALATGNINGDGRADAVVGRPEKGTGGQIGILHGTSAGLSPAATIDQDTTGVPGAGEAGDQLGASVAAGDVDGDGYDDVLAGLPGEDLTIDTIAHPDTGSALLLHGTATGATGTGSETYYASKNGFAGAAEDNDRLGTAVTLTDTTGDDHADAAIGASGENTGNGTIAALNTTTGTLDPATAHYLGGGIQVPAGSHIGDVIAP